LDEKRIRLLVNVYINTFLLDAEPPVDDIIDKLATPSKTNNGTGDEKDQRASICWITSVYDETYDANNLTKHQLKAAQPRSPNGLILQ
jgi:hypothetical protein